MQKTHCEDSLNFFETAEHFEALFYEEGWQNTFLMDIWNGIADDEGACFINRAGAFVLRSC